MFRDSTVNVGTIFKNLANLANLVILVILVILATPTALTAATTPTCQLLFFNKHNRSTSAEFRSHPEPISETGR